MAYDTLQRNLLEEDERNKNTTMKTVYHKKGCKYFVKLKLRRDPTASTSDLYRFRMYLFDNGDTEEFLLFVCNFNMTPVASGTLETGTKIFVHYSVVGHYSSLTSCLMMWKLRKP